MGKGASTATLSCRCNMHSTISNCFVMGFSMVSPVSSAIPCLFCAGHQNPNISINFAMQHIVPLLMSPLQCAQQAFGLLHCFMLEVCTNSTSSPMPNSTFLLSSPPMVSVKNAHPCPPNAHVHWSALAVTPCKYTHNVTPISSKAGLGTEAIHKHCCSLCRTLT